MVVFGAGSLREWNREATLFDFAEDGVVRGGPRRPRRRALRRRRALQSVVVRTASPRPLLLSSPTNRCEHHRSLPLSSAWLHAAAQHPQAQCPSSARTRHRRAGRRLFVPVVQSSVTELFSFSYFRRFTPKTKHLQIQHKARPSPVARALRAARHGQGSSLPRGKSLLFSFYFRADIWTPPVSDPLRHLSLQPAQSAPRVTRTHMSATLGQSTRCNKFPDPISFRNQVLG